MAVQLDQSSPSTSRQQPIQLYHQSSQYRFVPLPLPRLPADDSSRAHTPLAVRSHWRFSKEQLDKIRQDLNEQAVERVRTLWEEERVSWFPFVSLSPLSRSS